MKIQGNKLLMSKDVCVLIPTYNRPDDLKRALKSILERGNIPGKLLVLDQSKNKKTKKVTGKYKKRYSCVEYIHYTTAGTNLALNDGIKRAKRGNYKLICIIADDVEVLEGFLDKVLREFNTDEKVIGVGAAQISPPFNYQSLRFKLRKVLLNIALLPTEENHKFRITGPYGNTATPYVKKDVGDCQWLPGFVTCYRREIFDRYSIPNRIGYDVIEDIDMGYYTYLNYGKGSLVIPKDIQIYHHFSSVERYADKKRIFVNHEDHIAFYYRYFYTLFGMLKLFWELWWINILNIGRFFVRPTKSNALKIIYLWQALAYCWKYRKQIQAGKSRMFLNADLTMKAYF